MLEMNDQKEQPWTSGTIALSLTAAIAAGLVFLFLLNSLRSPQTDEAVDPFGAPTKHKNVLPSERPREERR